MSDTPSANVRLHTRPAEGAPCPSRSYASTSSRPARPPPHSPPANGQPWRRPRTRTSTASPPCRRGSTTAPRTTGCRRPSPAAAVFGATRNLAVTVSAITGPLHDPLRLAEEIAVLDLLSGGRLITAAGIGYRPEEYALSDMDWKRRGRLQDELLETLPTAWTGEPFGYRGRTVRITPRPFTRPHPLLLVGGSSKAAARRAARLGLPFFPSAHLPELEAYYRERLVEYGTEGWTMMPAAETPLLHVAEDPDRAWARYGGHFLHEARTYASWQSGGIRSAATTVDELRAEGVDRIMTPQQCAGLGLDSVVLHPLAGGMPVEEGRRSLRLFAEEVLPAVSGCPARDMRRAGRAAADPLECESSGGRIRPGTGR